MGLHSAVEGRRHIRRSVSCGAQLRESGGVRLQVDVRDLSETGFRVACPYPIAVGARVFLTLPSLAPLEAYVAWRAGSDHGCQFVRPLYPAVFDTIVARHG